MQTIPLLEKELGCRPRGGFNIVKIAVVDWLADPAQLPEYANLPRLDQILAWVKARGWHAEQSPDRSMIAVARRPSPYGSLFAALRPAAGVIIPD